VTQEPFPTRAVEPFLMPNPSRLRSVEPPSLHLVQADSRGPAEADKPSPESSSNTFPDLLQAVPSCRIDWETTRMAVELAFCGGVSGGLFTDALDRSRMAPSHWKPELYARDVFLTEFVNQCFKIQVGPHELPVSGNHLVRLLASPPSDVATVHHRRAIVAELARSPERRRELEQIYLELRRFRTLLEAATGIGRWDTQRRQLDLLQLLKRIIDTLAGSGFSRLSEFGQRVQSGEPYRSLSDLLAYDEHAATLDLKVRVGADGMIRQFEVRGVQQNDDNPFVPSLFRRWLSKVELFIRGYRFSDGEVLARIIDAVFDGLVDDVVPLVQLLGDIEFYLGALSFRDQSHAAGLEVCLPEIVGPDSPRRLQGFFNPLLFAQSATVVPCDLDLDGHNATVLVTGPNSGGKTRLLQALGLAQLLAQSGVFIPARSGTVALASSLVVSLIQETKFDQSEGRLGMELMRIRALFERLPPGAMVILDELCSGTNPSEGEEVIELVLRMLTKLRPQTFITTHFLAFAARLQHERPIAELRFLQVQFGPEQQPTYTFIPGVAHTSLAGQAASRLGVTGEQLMSLIERNIANARPF